jgi:hypothetical protein
LELRKRATDNHFPGPCIARSGRKRQVFPIRGSEKIRTFVVEAPRDEPAAGIIQEEQISDIRYASAGWGLTQFPGSTSILDTPPLIREV